MCLFLPGEQKEIYPLPVHKLLCYCEIFPSGYKLRNLDLTDTFISLSHLLHLFLPLPSFLSTLLLCQVNFPSLPDSLFVLLTFTSFHLLILTFMCWSLQVFPLYSPHSSLLDLWLFVCLCCLSLGFFLLSSLQPSHLFVF